MKAGWTKRTLNFTQPAGTSRGVMKTRDIWIITLTNKEKTGIGECAPLSGLSLDDFDQIEIKLNEMCQNPDRYLDDLSQLSDFPSIRFGFEMAHLDLNNGGGQHYFSNFKSIDINGLIWMGATEFMVSQVEEKLTEGWKCIKMKIGAIDFDRELEILKSIRSRFDQNELELRVDANGAFTENDVMVKLDKLSEFDIHSIEQPIKPGQWELLSELCQKSQVPIALDEELIPLIDEKDRIKLLEKVNPQYLVLKPTLLGGFFESKKWIQLAEERNIGWWVTSALESNIGLNAIAQWTSKMQPKGFQGLGTGQLFTNNIPSPLNVDQGILSSNNSPIWNDVNQFISDWYSPNDEMTLHTSGSTGSPKSIQVKKEWMRNSANLTGKTFGLKEGDSTLLCMPMKYVAGKMMVVRALELGLELTIVEPSSNPLEGISEQIDFAAMVPIQLENSIDQLDKVKTLIVGGGQVDPKLVERLQNVPTDIYETYGMTETLTHVAIKPLNGSNKSKFFQALDGVHFEVEDRGCLVIHTPMLNPNPIVTNDLVDLVDEASFRWLGRVDNVINSGGIKIIPEVVEAKLTAVISDRRFFIAGVPDESLGKKVILIIEGEKLDISLDSLEKYEEPKEIHFIEKFRVTTSGKIYRNSTLDMLRE
jgi:o-succinylbenzoate synthase